MKKIIQKVFKHKTIIIILIALILIITNLKTIYLDYYFKTVFPPYSTVEYYDRNWQNEPFNVYSDDSPVLAAKIKVNRVTLPLTKQFMKLSYDLNTDEDVYDFMYNKKLLYLPDWWSIGETDSLNDVYLGYKSRKDFSIVTESGEVEDGFSVSALCLIYIVDEADGMYLYIVSML
ncbi:MAG: hypothetical protein ACI4XH_02425 [Acutalibacteraceae bacterium]